MAGDDVSLLGMMTIDVPWNSTGFLAETRAAADAARATRARRR